MMAGDNAQRCRRRQAILSRRVSRATVCSKPRRTQGDSLGTWPVCLSSLRSSYRWWPCGAHRPTARALLVVSSGQPRRADGVGARGVHLASAARGDGGGAGAALRLGLGCGGQRRVPRRRHQLSAGDADSRGQSCLDSAADSRRGRAHQAGPAPRQAPPADAAKQRAARRGPGAAGEHPPGKRPASFGAAAHR